MSVFLCDVPPARLKMYVPKTVLLWGHENLLGYSVELLLNSRNDLELIKMSEKLGTDALLDQVEKVQPDVVVIYQLNKSSNANLPARLLQNRERLKVVQVNLENNSVEVFSKQTLQISEGTDLLEIVEGCPRLPCPVDISQP